MDDNCLVIGQFGTVISIHVIKWFSSVDRLMNHHTFGLEIEFLVPLSIGSTSLLHIGQKLNRKEMKRLKKACHDS